MQREFGLIVNDDCFRFTRFSFLKTGLAWEAGLLIKFNTMKLGKFWPVLCSVLYTTSHLSGQSDENLFQQLKRMDSLLFEVCFNQCRVDELLPYISQDLEFYHDQSGVMESRDQFMESVRTNICANMDFKPIRKLNERRFRFFLYLIKVNYMELSSKEYILFTFVNRKKNCMKPVRLNLSICGYGKMTGGC